MKKFIKYSLIVILLSLSVVCVSYYVLFGNMSTSSKPQLDISMNTDIRNYRETSYKSEKKLDMTPPPSRIPASEDVSIEELQEAILDGLDPTTEVESTASGMSKPNVTVDFTEQLRTANFGFTVNDKANIEDYVIAKFTIDTTKTIEEIRENLENIGIMVTDSISISKLVLVDIKAPDFEVTSISPNKQPINPNGSTNWKWKLKPKSEGEFPVELTVYAQVSIDGVEQSSFINSYDKEVIIEITKKQVVERWWENNWEWAWSTLIIPIGLFFREKIVNFFKKKKD